MMSLLELPHTAGCLVCGRDNPHGLKLSLFVEPQAGIVQTDFTPGPQHVGFDGILHGGVFATITDEAMVWAATWAGRRFCVAGEMTTRFRRIAQPGKMLRIIAKIEQNRPRLITASAMVMDTEGNVVAEATGKYVPVTPQQHVEFMGTILDESATSEAARILRGLKSQHQEPTNA